MTTYLSRTATLGTLFILALAFVPMSASAASSKTSCEVTVTNPRGETELRKKGTVLAKAGDTITIEWQSKNAKKATDEKGDTIALSGTKTLTVDKETTYGFKFANGSKKADCSVTLQIASASIDADTLTTTATKPTLSGEAKGVRTVQMLIENDNGKRVFKSKNIRVKKGEWKVKITKSLAEGTYQVTVLGDKKAKLNELVTKPLTVLSKDSSGSSVKVKGGALSVSAVPLLFGGSASAGASVPVAYIKVVNTGKDATVIRGFDLKQNGSAPTDVVIGFATSDDKGGSRTTVGGVEGMKHFKNNVAFVPLVATIEPGQLRIFTIKAILSKMSGAYSGKQLMLDVSGISSDASVKAALPIRGTTLTLTY